MKLTPEEIARFSRVCMCCDKSLSLTGRKGALFCDECRKAIKQERWIESKKRQKAKRAGQASSF